MVPAKVARKMSKVILNNVKTPEHALDMIRELSQISGLNGNVKIALSDAIPFVEKEKSKLGNE